MSRAEYSGYNQALAPYLVEGADQHARIVVSELQEMATEENQAFSHEVATLLHPHVHTFGPDATIMTRHDNIGFTVRVAFASTKRGDNYKFMDVMRSPYVLEDGKWVVNRHLLGEGLTVPYYSRIIDSKYGDTVEMVTSEDPVTFGDFFNNPDLILGQLKRVSDNPCTYKRVYKPTQGANPIIGLDRLAVTDLNLWTPDAA